MSDKPQDDGPGGSEGAINPEQSQQAGNQPPATQEPQPQPEEEGSWGRFSFWKTILLIFFVNQVINFVMQKTPKQSDLLDKEGDPLVFQDRYINLFHDGQLMNFTGYVSMKPYYKFRQDKNKWQSQGTLDEHQAFRYDHLKFNFDEDNEKSMSLTIPRSNKILSHNRTLYLHLEVSAKYNYRNLDSNRDKLNQMRKMIAKDAKRSRHKTVDDDDEDDDIEELNFRGNKKFDIGNSRVQLDEELRVITVTRSLPLFKYLQVKKKSKTANLFSDMPEAKEDPEPEVEEDGSPKPYVPHLKSELYLYYVPDNSVYAKNQIPPQFNDIMFMNNKFMYYEPFITISDFWNYGDKFVQINETVKDLNITLTIQPYSFYKFLFTMQYAQAKGMYSEMGMNMGEEMDMTKQMFAETNPYFLGLTMFVSIAHMVLEMLAFKNDIHFWKSRDSMKGISVRTLFIQIGMSVIIFLYLLDNDKETSYMILLPAGLGILLDCWKIKQACDVSSKGSFPWITISAKQSYSENDTDTHDAKAIKFMSMALFPMFLCYSVYSVVYNEHKGWYSYVINTLVGGVYLFGFITMTPQLYINYKLKSVEHMPGRALLYRFLNTIIDDLFSFIITMPTMHRLSCFRDDVIFVVYLYQRWAYKVDKNRDPYGVLKKKEEEAAAASVHAEAAKAVQEEIKDEGTVEQEPILDGINKDDSDGPYKRKNKQINDK